MDKNKIMNLIGTGTAVGALLIIATLFSNGGLSNWTTASQAADNEPITVQMAEVNPNADLETQNAQLQEAITIMQEREAEYQAKINEANDMLMNPEPVAAAYGEGEEYEEEEGEYDEEEMEKMEEQEEYEDEDEEEDEDDDDDDEGGLLGLGGILGLGEKDD